MNKHAAEIGLDQHRLTSSVVNGSACIVGGRHDNSNQPNQNSEKRSGFEVGPESSFSVRNQHSTPQKPRIIIAQVLARGRTVFAPNDRSVTSACCGSQTSEDRCMRSAIAGRMPRLNASLASRTNEEA
jgi:hypothetical protein